MTVRRRAFPLVLAAPSGAGKTSIARALVARNAEAAFSVSATTRSPRAAERDGIDYAFVDEDRFDRMIREGELLEWAVVHGHRYGTSRAQVRSALDEGRVVVLDIDVQGARQVRGAFPEAVLVFVLPPSADELYRRLAGRQSERPDELRRRLVNAGDELAAAAEFDYVLVNDDLEKAVAAVEAIVAAEKLRRVRVEQLEKTMDELRSDIAELTRRSE